jgi:hypothetical protein
VAKLDAPVDRRPLDELLPADPPDDLPWLKRFTLPSKEAGRLMLLLAEEGFDAAMLFPGLGGVVKSMREAYLSLNHPFRP